MDMLHIVRSLRFSSIQLLSSVYGNHAQQSIINSFTVMIVKRDKGVTPELWSGDKVRIFVCYSGLFRTGTFLSCSPIRSLDKIKL